MSDSTRRTSQSSDEVAGLPAIRTEDGLDGVPLVLPNRIAPGDRLTEGLHKVEMTRGAHRAVQGPDQVRAGQSFEIVRAERSSAELKRINTLPEPAARIGDRDLPVVIASEDRGPAVSAEPAALYLRDLTLNKSFNLLGMGRSNQIYMAAIVWDLSGRPPLIYPTDVAGVLPEHMTYAMKAGETVRFVGDGIQLWPHQHVTGGLHVHLIVMESDAGMRKLGEKMGRVREAIQEAGLAAALAGLAASDPTATALAVQTAAVATSAVAEKILKENGDDLVGVFQGTYGAEGITESRSNRYDQPGASITLNLHTGSAGGLAPPTDIRLPEPG